MSDERKEWAPLGERQRDNTDKLRRLGKQLKRINGDPPPSELPAELENLLKRLDKT